MIHYDALHTRIELNVTDLNGQKYKEGKADSSKFESNTSIEEIVSEKIR